MDSKYTPSNHACMSEYIDKFIEPYSKAKEECDPIEKGKKGQHGHYARLEDMYKAILPACRKNGLEIFHMRSPYNDDKEVMYTRITHKASGQWIQDVRFAESEKPGNQGKGGADTYCKRYALLALFGWPDNEDDDGQSEQDHIAQEIANPISQEQLIELQEAIKSYTNSKDLYGNIRYANKVKELSELSAQQFKGAMFYVQKKGIK